MKPIVKTTEEADIGKWIVGEFPENYEDMIYVDTMCGSLGVFLRKSKSKLEVLNDTSHSLIQIYRAIRDENADFSRKLYNVKCTEESFQKYLSNNAKNFEDYLDKAVNEFVLRKLSRGENKSVFSNRKVDWKKIAREILDLHMRLADTFIMVKDPLEIIQKFNSPESLVYHTMHLPQKDQYLAKLSNALRNFQGKAIVSCGDQSVYKNFFEGWTLRRKMLTRLNKRKLHYVWKNF